MEPDPSNPVPVAELTYQSESHVRAIDLVELVAKWCVALGAILISTFAVQALRMYAQNSFSSIRRSDWVFLALEVLRAAAAVWLLLCGMRVLRGKYGSARLLWVARAVIVLIQVISVLASVVTYTQNNYYAGDRKMQSLLLLSAIVYGITTWVPAAILLTIMRQPAVRDAIEEY